MSTMTPIASHGQNLFYHLLGATSHPPFTWTGLGGNSNWNTPQNWSNNSVPGAGDIARFRGSACSGTQCNSTMNVAVNVKGIEMDAAYTGTLTQGAGNTITIGTSGWTQAGGTFAGANSNIVFNGALASSGGVLTAPAATMEFYANLTIGGTSVFNHNNGTVWFGGSYCCGYDLNVNNTQFFNLIQQNIGSGGFELRVTGVATVNGTLTIGGGGSYSNSIQGPGHIVAKGNVTSNNLGAGGGGLIKIAGNGNQTITSGGGAMPSIEIASTGGVVTFVGSFYCTANFTYTSGAVDLVTNSTAVNIMGSYQTSTASLGTLTFYDLMFGNSGSGGFGLTLIGSPTVTRNFTVAGGPGVGVTGGTLYAQGNVSYSGAVNGSMVLVTSGGQNSTFTVSDGQMTQGNVSVAKSAAANTVTLVSNVSLSSAGQALSITSGTLDMAGKNLNVNGLLTVSAGATLLCNGGTLTFGSVNIASGGIVDCPNAGFSWTGLGGNSNWSTNGNWSGGVAPGVNDVAVFGNSCSGGLCNATVNVSTNTKGVLLRSPYTGTLTQGAGNTITIGTSGWTQAGGTFLGGNQTISIVDGLFYQSSGTFTSTSGTLSVSRSGYTTYDMMIIADGATFNHNSGTVSLTGWNGAGMYSEDRRIDVPPGFQLYNVVLGRLAGTSIYHRVVAGDSITVLNSLTQNGGSIEGQWILRGNLSVGAEATGGEGIITLDSAGAFTYAHSGGSTARLVLNNAGLSFQPAGGTTSLSASSLKVLQGVMDAPTGTLSLTENGYSALDNFVVADGATFNHNNGTVSLSGWNGAGAGAADRRIDVPAGFQLYNVVLGRLAGTAIYHRVVAGDTLTIINSLTQNGGSIEGQWVLKGNLSVGAEATGGSGPLTLSGTTAQTISGGAGSGPSLIIQNSSANISLLNSRQFSTLSILNGTLDLGAFNLTVTGNMNVAASGNILCNSGNGQWTAGSTSGAGIPTLSCGP